MNELKAVTVSNINVHINSYGGDVSEGLAIYNTLRSSGKNVTTICDGFACSAASVVFMAGSKRVMSPASLLMVHNAWTWAMGNSEELRKQADDLETITQASVEAYKLSANISEDEIKELMDKETWILPEDAKAYGFATDIAEEDDGDEPKQSAFGMIMNKLLEPTSQIGVLEATDLIDSDEIAGKVAERIIAELQKEEKAQASTDEYGWGAFFNH